MQLAKNTLGIVTDEILYSAEHKTNITLIFLNNESTSGIIVNLYIQYDTVSIRISAKNELVNAGGSKTIEIPFELNSNDMVRITTGGTGLSYVIQGVVIGQPIEDIITANVLANVESTFDTRYVSITDSGLTRVSTGSPFTARTFYNYYFDFDEADLEFTDCNFTGTCYVKNAGGAVTFSGTCRGFVPMCSDTLPDTIVGRGEVDINNFP